MTAYEKLLEKLRKQIKESLYQGYKLNPVKLESEQFDFNSHSISIWNQAQHMLWLLDQPMNPLSHKVIGFIQGWMFSQNMVTMNWLDQINSE